MPCATSGAAANFMQSVRRRASILALAGVLIETALIAPLKRPLLVSSAFVAVPSYIILFLLFPSAPRWGLWALGPPWKSHS